MGGEDGRKPAGDKAAPCARCRGRGWKLVSSRRALARTAADAELRATVKRRCLDCDGTGRE